MAKPKKFKTNNAEAIWRPESKSLDYYVLENGIPYFRESKSVANATAAERLFKQMANG